MKLGRIPVYTREFVCIKKINVTFTTYLGTKFKVGKGIPQAMLNRVQNYNFYILLFFTPWSSVKYNFPLSHINSCRMHFLIFDYCYCSKIKTMTKFKAKWTTLWE